MNQSEPKPQGRHAIQDSSEFLTIPEELLRRAGRLTAERIEHAHQEIGDALLAYLTLPDSNPASDHLEEDFLAAYRGDHETIDEAIHSQIDGLGWADALHQMTHANGLPADALIWNLELIRTQMGEVYDFVEYAGRIYQFLK